MFVGWVKKYSDGTSYLGADNNSSTTWRNSSNENIISVALTDGSSVITISGAGTYWQSDDCFAPMRFGNAVKGVTYKRRIQRLVEETDVCFTIDSRDKSQTIAFVNTLPSNPSTTFFLIDRNWIGKWITIELDIGTGASTFYISEDKI